MQRPWVRACSLPGILAVLLAGCSAIEFKPQLLPFSNILRFDVIADAQMNNNYPVAVDLVIIYSPQAKKTLSQLDAAKWFAAPVKHLSQFEDYETQRLSWEWVPGAQIPRQEVKYKLGADGAILFARYFSKGPHVFIMDGVKDFKLELGPQAFQVRPVKSL